MVPENLVIIARDVLSLAGRSGLSLITAASCTSGMLAAGLSEAPGAAKLLSRRPGRARGPVADARRGQPGGCLCDGRGCADPLARRRRCGDHRRCRSIEKTRTAIPSGLVCIAVARKSHATSVLQRNYGDIGRGAVRACAMRDALLQMQQILRAP